MGLFVTHLGSGVCFTESGCTLFLAGPAEQEHLSELRQFARVSLNWGTRYFPIKTCSY